MVVLSRLWVNCWRGAVCLFVLRHGNWNAGGHCLGGYAVSGLLYPSFGGGVPSGSHETGTSSGPGSGLCRALFSREQLRGRCADIYSARSLNFDCRWRGFLGAVQHNCQAGRGSSRVPGRAIKWLKPAGMVQPGASTTFIGPGLDAKYSRNLVAGPEQPKRSIHICRSLPGGWGHPVWFWGLEQFAV